MRRVCVFLGIFLLAGCRAGDTIGLWKDAVEEYVRTCGAGDLSALQSLGDSQTRDELRPALATVSVRGIWATDAKPAAFRDAHGLLVGLAQSGAGPWYVFAVGICDPAAANEQAASVRQHTVDVRVAAIRGGPERFEWRFARSDAEQTSRYLSGEMPEWPALDVRWPFPRAADDFTLTSSASGVQVLERRSGATWTMGLPQQ